jgi:hypothetical protein
MASLLSAVMTRCRGWRETDMSFLHYLRVAVKGIDRPFSNQSAYEARPIHTPGETGKKMWDLLASCSPVPLDFSRWCWYPEDGSGGSLSFFRGLARRWSRVDLVLPM